MKRVETHLGILFIHLSGTEYKIWRFYLYLFWKYKALNISHCVTYIQTHIHIHKQIFKNHFFGTSTHENQVKN